MITVGDIVALPTLHDARLVAGPEAPHRGVRNVGIMDHEILTGGMDGFFPNEAIFTALGCAAGNPALADRTVIELAQRDVAAIFIKDILVKEATDAMRVAVEAAGIPLYLYSGGLVEDILAAAKNLLADDEHDAQNEQAIEDLLAVRDDAKQTAKLFAATRLAGPFILAAVFRRPETTFDAASAAALRTSFAEVLAHEPHNHSFICRHREALLVLLSHDTDSPEAARDGRRIIRDLHRSAGLGIACGVGELLDVSQADASIIQAHQAAVRACAHGHEASLVSWADGSMDAFCDAAAESTLMHRACRAARNRLEQHDVAHGSDLTSSMRAFARLGGDIQQTADFLHQHPNSVRNRLRKAKAVLGQDTIGDRELYAFMVLAFLDDPATR